MGTLIRLQKRMQSLASLEPLMKILRDVSEGFASSVEFVPHETWLGDSSSFATQVRDETENKVFLLENMSAFPEELGVHYVERKIHEENQESVPQNEPVNDIVRNIDLVQLPWATREAWAMRTFKDLLPDILVQDSFAAACKSMTSHVGLWAGAPQRVVGPLIETEINSFIEALQLPFSTSAENPNAGGTTSVAGQTDLGSISVPAPLLAVIGGGGFGNPGGEETLLRKLELLLGIAQLMHYEKDGLLIALGGEL